MFGRYPQVLTPESRENRNVFDVLGVSTMDVWKAAGRQAYDDSPSISFLYDPKILSNLVDPEFADVRAMAASGYFDKPKISKEEFEEKYGNTRLKFDPNFTIDKIEDILKRDKQREINEFIISRGKGGLVEAIGKFGVEVIAGNLSPINIAASFVPIGRAAWWTASALRYGALKTTLAKGFASGVIGQAAIEPFLYSERKSEQREYSLQDSFVNILQSGLFGSTLHGLGYGAKILRDKYFAAPETLADHIKTNHPVVDGELKTNIKSVLNESDPSGLKDSTALYDSSTSLQELQAAKLELITRAEAQFPEYFNQYKKVAALEQSMHEKYYAGDDISVLPRAAQELLEQEKAKLQATKDAYIDNVELQEYLNKNAELDNNIKHLIRTEQFENKAYDLSPENLYIAKSQINDGKHINLDNPHNAESIYENSENEFKGVIIKNSDDIVGQVASLEQEIAGLPDNYKKEYTKALLIDQEVIRLSRETTKKIKQSAGKKDIEPLLQSLSLYDEELANNLRSLHKAHIAEAKLLPLELNKSLDQIVADCFNRQFLQKRDKALNLIKLANNEIFVRRFKNKVKGIFEMLRQTDLTQTAIYRSTMFSLVNKLKKANVLEMFSDKNFESAFAQEIWNITHPDKVETSSEIAKTLAKTIHQERLELINRANAAGANITPLLGFITHRTHNAKKLREAGFDKWFEFIEPILDKERTGNLDFKQIYNNLATETHLREVGDYLSLITGDKDIAAKISASRKLHFKDAVSELNYLREFGNYSKPNIVDKALGFFIPEKSFLAESILSDFSRLSKAIGILENLGSKPQDTLNSLRSTFVAELQGQAAINPRVLKEMTVLQRSSKFDGQLDLMLGTRPEVPNFARITGAYRALKCISNLGSVVISSIPDAITFVTELQNNDMPALQAYSNIFKAFTNSKEKKELGRLLGVVTDSLLGSTHARFSPDGAVAGSISKLTDAFFKLNFMQWWDDTLKSTAGNLLSHNLAVNTGKAFGNLDKRLKILLERYSINENNWHLYKSLVQEIKGNSYLIPDISLLPDHIIDAHLKFQRKPINDLNRTRLKQDITNNLQRYLIDRVDTAIPTAHTHEQSVMQLAGLGIKDGTPMAEIIKCLMQFKTFAYTYAARPLKAITLDQIPVHEQQGFGTFNKDTWKDLATSLQNPTTLKSLSQLLIGTTTLGYLSLNAARMLKGQEPLAPNEKGVFMAAGLKGGGLGFYGDFMFGEYDRYRHNLLESLAGPIGGDFIDVGKIYSKALRGEPDAIELTTNLFKRNIPGRNLFYLSPALFRLEKHLNNYSY